MEMGWGADIWDFRINLKYAPNLPLLRADRMGGSPQSTCEAWRHQMMNKKYICSSYCSPFPCQRKNSSLCKGPAQDPGHLGYPSQLLSMVLMGFLQRQQHQGLAHSSHLLYRTQTNFLPSFSSSNQVVIFLLGNYRITKQYRQNYTRQSHQR